MRPLPRNTTLVGDARSVLSGLLGESIDACITSPPYFQLRDYGHRDQLGQEASIDEWVENLRGVFAEVARVLKPRGNLWVNVGDTFSRHRDAGAPPKSLLLGPERLILGLLADGWLVRGKVVWAKPNALPESAADRFARTYEVIYHLVRSPDYYFDLDRVREPHRTVGHVRPTELTRRYQGGNSGLGKLKARGLVGHAAGRNPRDVWTFPTAVDRDGHQATFPESLIERPILSSCPERICEQCDLPWIRPTRWLTVHTSEGARHIQKVGDLQRCDCFAPSRAGVVLDPFAGTGTVPAVAERLNRDWLGIELNPRFAALTDQRLGRQRAA